MDILAAVIFKEDAIDMPNQPVTRKVGGMIAIA